MLLTIPRPRPVPTSFLVVKNGVKIWQRIDSGIPTPCRAPRAECRSARNGVRIPTRALDGVPGGEASMALRQIRDDLPEFAGQRVHPEARRDLFAQPDLPVAEAAMVNRQHLVDGCRHVDPRRGGSIAVKPQRLARDMGDALHLLVGHHEADTRGLRQTRILPREIDQVGHHFERVVDLVGHGRGQTPHRRELLRGAQRGLQLFLRVTSRRILDAPMMVPWGSRTGEW